MTLLVLVSIHVIFMNIGLACCGYAIGLRQTVFELNIQIAMRVYFSVHGQELELDPDIMAMFARLQFWGSGCQSHRSTGILMPCNGQVECGHAIYQHATRVT